MASFDKLWTMYPREASLKAELRARCGEGQSKQFSNYCAIELSECLIRSGESLHKLKGKKCWSHSGAKHALLAEDLAAFLTTDPPTGFGNREKIPPGQFQKSLDGRTGVIFFKDYWRRGSGKTKESQANRSGDHIDLWNKDRITSSGMFLRGLAELFGAVSDLNQAREIWFWEVR